MVNLTGIGATGPTFLSAYGDTNPGTSNLNVLSDRPAAVMATVPVGADRAIRVFNQAAQTHVIITVLGWFVPGDEGSRYAPVTGTRLVDTRDSQGPHPGPLTAGETVAVPVTGVPSQATAAAVNIAAVSPTANTYLTAWAHDATFPGNSTLNVAAGDITANSATTRLGTAGRIDIRNSDGATHLFADLQGYYTR